MRRTAAAMKTDEDLHWLHGWHKLSAACWWCVTHVQDLSKLGGLGSGAAQVLLSVALFAAAVGVLG